MLDSFLAASVPLWALIVLVVATAILATALARKFGTAWLALIGHLFTVNDVKYLCFLLWRSNVLPKSVKKIRFSGSEEKFVQSVIDMVLDLLPEIQKLDETLVKLANSDKSRYTLQPDDKVLLEGRRRYIFRGDERPDKSEGQREGFPLPDRTP